MTPQNCASKVGEAGDCYRACLATILDIDATTVPNFNNKTAGDLQFDEAVRDFLRPKGLSIFNFYCDGGWSLEKTFAHFSKFNFDVPMILTGKPLQHTDPAHSVVVLNGAIIHDPSGAGISGPCGENWFIDVVAATRGKV